MRQIIIKDGDIKIVKKKYGVDYSLKAKNKRRTRYLKKLKYKQDE